ncbi:hypothetical protein ACWKTZ_24405 [Bacillus cereus]
MELKGTSKYNIGAEVYTIEEDYKYPPCSKCEGTGELELVIGGTVPCTDCYGKKIDESEHLEVMFYKTTERIKIDTVGMQVTENETAIIYWGKNEEGYSVGIVESECFPSLELAEQECKNRGEKLTDEL